jgi:NAD+ diphosphatase
MSVRTPPKLSAAAYDRAAHRRAQPQWLADAWEAARVLVVSPRSATPVVDETTIAFRDPRNVAAGAPRRFLGVADGVAYFAVTADRDDDRAQWRTLRDLGPVADDLQVGLFTAAIALEQWHQRHAHCPLCGAETVESQAGWTRTCPDDGSEHFPRTDPAVIMLIHDGAGSALLGRGPHWPAGRFSTLAGFVEPGESLEAAVAREVYEEVGVRVRDVSYVASQPWPFPSSLMLGFSGRLDGDRELHLDPAEMAEAGWFSRAQVRRAAASSDAGTTVEDSSTAIRAVSPQLSISRYLIDLWLDEALP